MRLALDPRARRLLRRLPRNTVYSAMELVLLSLLAVQCARLAWTLVTPLGPVGDWKAGSALRPVAPGSSAVLASFDPFFRLSGGGATPAVVTSLNLKLFGVREDRASGRGSAIIGTPDGQQRSFAVGEEIMPGVTLTAVGYDNVTVSRSAAGLQPGDVVTSVNGQRITSAEQARGIAARLRGGEANVEVERGGRTVSLRVRAGQ